MASTTTDNTTPPNPTPAADLPTPDVPTTPKPTSTITTTVTTERIYEPPPNLARQTSFDSFISIDSDHRRPRRPIRNPNPVYIRPYTPSPPRRRAALPANHTLPPLLTSSAHFLSLVGTFDGTADLPRPSRGPIYLTTYPFSRADVAKHAWLFSLGVQDVFLAEDTRARGGGRDVDFGGDTLVYPTARRAYPDEHNHPWTTDIPCVYLSRALDTSIVPEHAENVKFLIVCQNRHRPAGSKLLVAESRRAAGILMFYEALKGDSVVFVGAAVGWGDKRVHPGMFRRVERVDEERGEGVVGIVC